MQLITKPVKSYYEKIIWFLKLLINPNSFLFKDREKDLTERYDIRSSPKLRIVGKKIIYFLRTLFLMITDNLAIVISWISITQFSQIINADNFIAIEELKLNNINYLWLMVVTNLSIFVSAGLYSTKDKSRRIRDALSACSFSYIVFIVIVSIFEQTSRINFLFSLTYIWLFSLFGICFGRFLIFRGIKYVRNRVTPLKRKVILVGLEEDIDKLKELFRDCKNFDVVDTLDLLLLNSDNFLNKFEGKTFSQKIDELVICSWEKIENPIKIFWALQTSGISWRILPTKQSLPQHNYELADMEGLPTIRYGTSIIVGIDFLVKRIFDLVATSILLVILSIPMLVIGLLIKLDSPGSVFYKQTRIGLKGEKFKVWKFRTMVENASELQKELEKKNEISGGILFKISEDPRITTIGKYLRRYSLDELPQLFNVLRGEMSLVGPRPLPIRDVEKFEKHHHFRHEILPGITGLWQISGRSDTSSEQVFKLDFQYIENWSLAIDLKILLKTVFVVLFSKGAY